ncbi:MAG: hypothetical protein J4F36_11995 [Nitrosopumilaceae archaeon]|nr:hypothetical protein [Nitrosopumilaceae archaeon]
MNLLRCKTCNKILTSEESKRHTMCYVNQTKSRQILASHISILQNDNDENCVMITGLDGTTYTIIEKKPELVPFEPLNQPQGNRENNYRDGNSTS